jgi:hypothetical protein
MNGSLSFLTMPDGTPAGLFSEEEAGRYLGLAPGTLRNWRCRRRGPPFVQAGRRICYRIEDLQAWAEERLVDGRGR